jgi:Leucine-rich repeat (LRR) protein
LRILNFSNNNIENIPSTLGQLLNLEELNFERNSIKNIPSELGEIEKLKVLIMGYNKIEYLPCELGQLKQLEKISLNDNELITLPSEIESCENLIEIDIVRNRLVNLPYHILDLSNLNRLYISNTNISTINIQNTNINFNHSGLLVDCWANIPLTYICCDAEDVPALTTFLTNCGHNLANITIDTTQTCALSSGAIKRYNIAVYPNTSTGTFNLTLPAVFNGNIEVFNTLGQKVYDTTFENQQNMVLDLSHLEKGLYVLKVVNADGERFEEKVIIN